MTIYETLLLAVALSMDAFSVSIPCGIYTKVGKKKDLLLTGLTFGFFQGMMVFLGYAFASNFRTLIESVDHYIAFVLLLLIGANMIRESFGEEEKTELTSIKMLLLLGIATSIDALAAGVSLISSNINIISTSLIIGFTTLTLSYVGVLLGVFAKNKMSRFSKHIEILGGLILIGIGTKILLTSIF